MQPSQTGETTDQQAQQPAQDQVQGQDVTVGTGAEATPGSQVSVTYEGRLQDGTVFDSSAAHNDEPLVFVLGAQGLIPGFQIGVNGMKVGGERMILIPPSLGYGAQEIKDASGKVIIPANSPIVFNVKLIKVEPAPETPVN
ncbi:FKBP-type peptidyl-prolyl cis-trans isomerase [Candidatus Kaiserbacteria bacterium]|nr:FKBP-type peptidyl-prolyl cis-trans isomerase [Candidatus Kaiserbacteria bacterium]